jgi:hypothetical protein
MEYYSALRRKETLSHATTLVDIEDIMLREISQLHTIWYNFCEISKVVKFIETKSTILYGRDLEYVGMKSC